MSKKSKIVSSLREGLESGAFPLNEPLPSEHALMKRHGVARGTVRAAIAELLREGLVEVRGKSGTYPVAKKVVTFAVLFPDASSPLATAVSTGLAQRAKCHGGGGATYALLWGSPSFPGGVEGFAELAVGESVAGVFLVPFKGRADRTANLIARFNAAHIPVVLMGGEVPKRKGLVSDLMGVNLLSSGKRVRVDLASATSKRSPTLLAHGELIGDVALRLMLQRFAFPEHPPCELYLDLAEEPERKPLYTNKHNKRRIRE